MEIIKLAWRNIWRNKRRTIITASSLMFAVIFGISLRSVQLGTYDHMIDSAVRQYSGFIQIQDTAYWKEKTINDLLVDSIALRDEISQIDGVISVLPRLESFALISSGNKTKGALLMGIDPLLDDKMTQLSHKVVKGDFLTKDDEGIMVSQRLAAFLNINVGDTIVLISQGYHGATAADIFPVRGIVHMPNPKLDKSMLVVSLKKAQDFYGAPNMLTSMVVNIESKNRVDEILPQVEKYISNSNMIALSWTDMNKELRQQIAADSGAGKVMLFILYVVVFFGILGTIIMMTAERQKEFGVMVALGMQKWYLSLIVFLETLFLGAVGIFFGGLVSIGIVSYFYGTAIPVQEDMKEIWEQFGIEPVVTFSKDYHIFLNQFLIVFVLLLVAVIYPMIKIFSFKIIDALRS